MKSLIPHLIAVFLVVGAPIWDLFEIRRLKVSADPRVRVKWYAKVVVASWTLAVIAVLATGGREIWNIAETVSWLPHGEGVKAFLIGLLVAMLVGRFVSTPLMKYVSPSKLLGIYGVANVALMGFAVVGLRWHYPSDALVGATFGAGFVLTLDAVLQQCRLLGARAGSR